MGAQTSSPSSSESSPQLPTLPALVPPLPGPKDESVTTTDAEGEKKPKCKACCACPETKRVRDDCIVQHGEENCTELIEAHKKCMRDMGFNI